MFQPVLLTDLDRHGSLIRLQNIYNFLFGPPVILSLCFIFLAIIGYEYFWGWGVSLLFMIMGPYLYRTWFYIIYAYQHRHDIEETRPIKHIEVSSDLIQNKEFDKNRFKKEKKHD